MLAATDYVTPAVEIIDARIEQFDRDTKAPRKVFDTIADFAANAGIVTRRPAGAADEVDLRWVGAMLYKNGVDRGDRPGRRRARTTRATASPGWPTRSRRTASSSNAGDVVLGRLVHAADAGRCAATSSTSTTARSASIEFRFA